MLTIVLRHQNNEACLAELARDEGLRRLIGIDSDEAIPSKWNMSRFEETLGSEPHRTHLQDVFNRMMQTLGEVVPELGK